MVTVPDTTKCFLKFTIEHDLKPPVLFYYRMTNFHQNHRFYITSFDAQQLAGFPRTAKEISESECDKHLRLDDNNTPYYPCGLIANSMFNDTFLMPRLQSSNGNISNDSEFYNMSNKGISWKSERNLYKKTLYNPGQVVPPPNWARKWNYSERLPDLSVDESFQVWMRTASLPVFSKLAMRNDHAIMKRGLYEIEIWDGIVLRGGYSQKITNAIF